VSWEQPRFCTGRAYVGWLGAGDNGRECYNLALAGSEFCAHHDPDAKSQRRRRNAERWMRQNGYRWALELRELAACPAVLDAIAESGS
jgi:hypothetical protein